MRMEGRSSSKNVKKPWAATALDDAVAETICMAPFVVGCLYCISFENISHQLLRNFWLRRIISAGRPWERCLS